MTRWILLPCLALAFAAAAFTSTQSLNKDALIFFQGGLRVAAGQVPFRDFSLPQGPVGPLVAGFFFGWLPRNIAWAVVSGLLNAAMAALAFFAVKRVTQNTFAAGVAAAASALAFLPPFGSFYNDHLAYFFVAAAFCVFFFSSPLLRGRAAASGLFFALAFHTKQTVGIAGLASFFAAFALSGDSAELKNSFRPLVWFAAFLLGGWLLIGLAGGGNSYWWDAVWLPFTYAQNSDDKSTARLLTFLIFPWGITPSDLLADLPRHWGRWALFPFQCLFWFWLWRWPTAKEKKITVVFFCLSTLWGGALLGRASSHLFLGTGVVLGLVLAELSFTFPLRVSRAAAALAVALCTLQFAQTSWNRRRENTAPSQLVADQLRGLPPQNLYALGEQALRVASLAGLSPRQTNLYDDMAVSVPSTFLGMLRWQTRFREEMEKRPPDWILQDDGWLVYPGLGTRLYRHLDENYAEVCRFTTLRVLKRRNLASAWLPPTCQKPSPATLSSLP